MPDTKTEPAAPKKREKNPTYHVLRNSDGGWQLLTKSPISASSRRAAIIEATKAEAKKDGEFLVLPEKEYKPIKRGIQTQTIDTFE